MDLPCQRRHLFGQVLVGLGELRVRFQQLPQLSESGLRVGLLLLVPAIRERGGPLVALRLPRRREQDQRRRVGGLEREREVQEDEGVGIPAEAQPDRIQCDPDGDEQGLPGDVLGRAEETGSRLRASAERVLAERAMVMPGWLRSARLG